MARPVVNRWDGARELRAGPAPVSVGSAGVHLDELQRLMEQTYGLRDTERGVAATIAWLTEELGELAQAVRKGTREQQLHELGDVLAWLASLSAQLGLSMSEAVPAMREAVRRVAQPPANAPTHRFPPERELSSPPGRAVQLGEVLHRRLLEGDRHHRGALPQGGEQAE